jgi:hypothetical protein
MLISIFSVIWQMPKQIQILGQLAMVAILESAIRVTADLQHSGGGRLSEGNGFH